ncbi:hypothetical protein J6590_089444 [Homalodisca vitripennis]|nr:hypothetical protein J6590_089444 [Homalodisca vitripennis]
MGGRHDILLRLDRAVWCYILLLVSIIKSAGPQLMSNINKQVTCKTFVSGRMLCRGRCAAIGGIGRVAV